MNPIPFIDPVEMSQADLVAVETHWPICAQVTPEVVENLGASVLILVHAGEHKFQVSVPEEDEPAVGDRGWVLPQQSKTLLFDRETTQRIG